MKNYSTILAVAMVAFAAAAPVMAQNEASTYAAAYMTADHNMRSSKLIGLPVYNDHGEKIGVIDEIMLPAKGGEVTAAVSVGGFLGGGAKLVKIPLSHVQLTGGKPTMVGDGTKTALMAMPTYTYSMPGGAGG